MTIDRMKTWAIIALVIGAFVLQHNQTNLEAQMTELKSKNQNIDRLNQELMETTLRLEIQTDTMNKSAQQLKLSIDAVDREVTHLEEIKDASRE